MDKSDEIRNKLTVYCKQNKISLTDDNFYSICKKALTKEAYELCFLPDDISKKVDEFAVLGDKCFDKEEYGEAIKVYKKGIEIIPEPKNLWGTKLWFTAGIADAYWQLKKYKNALEFLDESLLIEGGIKNAFVRLRRGQVLFELSRINEAIEELKKGYELGGEELFEDEDKKYIEVIQPNKI